MADELKIKVNGRMWPVAASADTPLLYVLSNELRLQGPRFGCGLAQCGSCSVLADGAEIRSCVTPVSAVGSKKVTTIEGLSADGTHPVQRAWEAEQVPQCGYCQSGMIIMAAELLARKKRPTDAEIKKWMDPHLCRCATHNAIVRAIKRAARATA